MKRRKFLKLTSASSLVTLITPIGVVHVITQKSSTSLEQKFLRPSMSERPYCMWMWMNGQVTKQGITLDLEAMVRGGIGGVFNFETGSGIPKGPLKYLSPEWFDIKSYTFKEAERLGLEFAMHNCPGWSSSGGPWITPANSMKQTTFSKNFIDGGKKISLRLQKPEHQLNFYKDIAVLAYPTLDREETDTKGETNFADWQKKTNLQFSAFGVEAMKEGNQAIDSSKIILLTDKMQVNDTLDWDPPKGKWTILRLGFTTTGVENRAAPDTGIGLECDKYDADAVELHFYKMMDALLPSMKTLVNKKKIGLEIDSFEVGMQNWTDNFEKEFEKRNGYSFIEYLPAMTGKLVDNADVTERVLWDLRRTQADLLADNYYGKFAELCKKHAVNCYFEPYDRCMMEEMQVGARADSNMGEYWNGLSVWLQNNKTMRRTPKLIASIAHVNGQKIAGVEGLTAEPQSGKWQEYAFAMKPVCDHIFTQGVNRIVFHRYAHQPHPTAAPAMTMGDWGIHFERTNTLWEVNRAWLEYVARCQTLLRQGLFVADLAYFTGENPGVYTPVNRDELNPFPTFGYDYDVINAETLLKKAKVQNGRLVLDKGMSYRVLVLQQQQAMSLALLRQVYQFVKNGLTVIGSRPQTTPGLKTFSKEASEEFKKVCNGLWGDENAAIIDKQVGQGHVFWGQTLDEILDAIKLTPDFTTTSGSGDAPVKYIHRVVDGTHIYFIANQRRSYEDVVCNFRVSGKTPELWDPVTGKISHASIYQQDENKTSVGLSLTPYQSLFVIFREPAKQQSIRTIKLNDRIVLSANNIAVKRKLYADVTNNFSITCWAKPEMDIMLSTRAYYENVKGEWTDFYALYPAPGNKWYGEGHSTIGFTVGRNGVAVWENADGQPKFVVGCPADLSGWNHIAIIYEEGFPSVYLNGKLIGQGDKKIKNIVHPSFAGSYLSEGASYYNGDMTPPELFMDVLTPEKIMMLAKVVPVTDVYWKKTIEPLGINNQWLIWKKGNYIASTTEGNTRTANVAVLPEPIQLNGSWDMTIVYKTGQTKKLILPELISLKDHQDSEVKYFSGTATYKKQISVSKDFIGPGKKIFIDLGKVEVVAEVIVNAKDIGIFWTRPYLADITDAVKAGENMVEIKVTNQWVNRLIGDEQLPEVDKYSPEGNIEELPDWYQNNQSKPDNGRFAFTTWKHFEKTSPLLESGLIGPVVLRAAVVKTFRADP